MSLDSDGSFVPVWDFGPERLDQVLELFAQTAWAHARTSADVRQLLAGPGVNIGLVEVATGRLVAFARALTDGIYKAIVEDVIVREDLRGQRLGSLLLEAVLAHPRISRVEEIELYCAPERERFYKEAGFEVVPEQLFMRQPGRMV